MPWDSVDGRLFAKNVSPVALDKVKVEPRALRKSDSLSERVRDFFFYHNGSDCNFAIRLHSATTAGSSPYMASVS